MTDLLFRDDPYLLEFDASVVSVRDHGGRPGVVLDRTAFYAESGGQPSDTGTLGGVAVVSVLEEGSDVVHVLAAPLSSDRVHGSVDPARRRHYREQHHGQHLLSRAFLEVSGARTVSVHLGEASSSVDLDRDVGEAEARAAERRANEVVWGALPVHVRTVSRGEAEALGLHPAAEAGDRIRLVEAAGYDLQPCCGTHPRSTSEVGVVLVLGRERYKGGSRVRFACGHRALEAVRERVGTLDELSRLLSAPLEGLPEAGRRVLDQLAEATRRGRELLEDALETEARRLLARAGSSPARVVAAYDAWPAADLRALAQKVVSLAPAVALLASRGAKTHLVFAQSPGLPHDIPGLLVAAASRLGGKGGGRGDLAQGGSDSAVGLDEVLAAAAARLDERAP